MVLTDCKNKNSLGADDLRRRREEQQVEIRRQNIAERQYVTVSDSDGADSDDDGSIAVRGSNLSGNVIVMRSREPHSVWWGRV